jgi:hypothetical protein
MATSALERILEEARHLSSDELTRLRDELAALTPEAPARQPLHSLYGALADLGPAPSAEDIDEMRREAWSSWSTDA